MDGWKGNGAVLATIETLHPDDGSHDLASNYILFTLLYMVLNLLLRINENLILVMTLWALAPLSSLSAVPVLHSMVGTVAIPLFGVLPSGRNLSP
jgi:hypothetical protein